jgi:hypothetical protein
MNRLEKENLKKAVSFEELREVRLAAFNLASQDIDTAFLSAVALSRIVTNSNCEIMIDQDVVSAAISFLQISTSNDHAIAVCDLLLAMFPHELESVQENILKASGIQFLEAARHRFPNSTQNIIDTLQQCVHFFNSGQNNARETGVLTSILELNKNFPEMYDTSSCIHAMCSLNYQSSVVAEAYGVDAQYTTAPPAFDDVYIPVESQRSETIPTTSRSVSSKAKSSSRSLLNSDNLPFEIGAQIRAITSLKESFATDKSGSISTIANSPTELFKKSLQRSHVVIGSERIRNPLLEDEESTLDDVATRILGPRKFMDVLRRADAILKKEIPETRTSEVFGPQNFSFKTQGRISNDAWSSVRYVQQIPTGSLGTKYGQHEVSFLKWFYAGQMSCEDAHGNGVFRWVNGSKYAGQIQKNKRHGIGKMVFDTADMSMASDLCTSSGTSYCGSWENDKIHGIGVFTFHRDDGGGTLCAIFDQGKITPYSFTEDVLPEHFIEAVHIEERKADALSAEAIQNASSTIFRHNYDANDGHFLFPLHYTPKRALIQRPGDRGEETTNIRTSRF